ncbi:MAG: anhydro-N-acetylmuramic acid kinase [Bacteroidetes bacterium]|nr:MAG: anhydro-N-acetylmuramic acid kinase [Bacteroidota bacterium]
MKQYQGIGMMSGTSMDGLDIVCCKFTEEEPEQYQYELLAAETIDFDPKWEARLKHLPAQPAEVYAKTDVYFGHWLGRQVKAFIERHGLQPDFVASHGQTIFHQPEKSFTAQIGDGETLVAYLNCPLVCNFRNKDVALKGEGAPLVPLGEKYLFPPDHLYLNLGGFANISLNGRAFDVCACNIVLNYLVREHEASQAFDEGGAIAASGHLDENLLSALNGLPYYRQKPPKTLGWEWVSRHILPLIRRARPRLSDALHTLVHHIAIQSAYAVDSLQGAGKPIIITGGGRHNTFLMQQLREQLASRQVEIADHLPAETIDFKEAIIFAFLGLRVLQGKANVLKEATGAEVAAPCGSVHLPPIGSERFALL